MTHGHSGSHRLRRRLSASLATGLLLSQAGVVLATDTPDYPVTLTDLAGRQVTIDSAPTRIVLQESNDLVAMALLESDSPVARVVGWQDTLQGSQPSLWSVMQERWPEMAEVPEVTFSTSGEIDSEGIVSLVPDLVVARLPARNAIESGSLASLLKALDIPLVYIDTEYEPLKNVPRSLRVLGKALASDEAAEDYIAAYESRMQALLERTQALPSPKVFVEVRAGESGDDCCKTHNTAAWGSMVTALGAENVASGMLGSLPSGTVSLEALISHPPDRYLMTGTQRTTGYESSVPLGYRASDEAVQDKLATLMARPGFKALQAQSLSCVTALNHQFYNSVFNVVGLEYLAKAIWPQALADMDPAASYTDLVSQHSHIPTDVPFIFAAERCAPGGEVAQAQ